jgi:hypothetical protein
MARAVRAKNSVPADVFDGAMASVGSDAGWVFMTAVVLEGVGCVLVLGVVSGADAETVAPVESLMPP